MRKATIGPLLAGLAALALWGCSDDPVGPGAEDPSRTAIPADDAVTSSDLQSSLLGDGEGTESAFVIVEYDESVTSGAAIQQRALDAGAGARALAHLPFVGVLGTAEQISRIGDAPGVVRISPNRRLEWHANGPVTPRVAAAVAAALDRSVSTIGADRAREEFGVTGEGIGVAILDSGIDGVYQYDVQYPSRTVQNLKILANGEDLLCFPSQPCPGSIYVENLANSETSVGHGTHVAGIAGGNGTMSDGLYTGVAPRANLIGIGTGDVLFVFWALAGFDWILGNQDRYDIQVVNNSWGTSGEFDPLDPINVATRELADRGITVVFSAGNCGQGEDPTCPAPEESQLNPYGLAPWTIGVAAACSDGDEVAREEMCDGGRLAYFSSRGLPGDPVYHPDVTAPGVWIVSARASTGTVMNGLDANRDLGGTSDCGIRDEHLTAYTCASGTSMSAPHVTGLVALMQQRAGAALSPGEVLDLLRGTADPMDGYEPYEVGAGMVNAYEAVKRAKSASKKGGKHGKGR